MHLSTDIDGARERVKTARAQIRLYECLKVKAEADCDDIAIQVYSEALRQWKEALEQREERLVQLVLGDFTRQGVWA